MHGWIVGIPDGSQRWSVLFCCPPLGTLSLDPRSEMSSSPTPDTTSRTPVRNAQSRWVIGPGVDLSCITPGWLLLMHELRSPQKASFPKILFLLSVVFLYGIGPTLSAGAIYIATSINRLYPGFSTVKL